MSDERRFRIFVTDDEHVIALTLSAILRSSGFEATGFTDPRAALAAADTTPPDLLLSDVVMPHMSGIDLAMRMQKTHPECRILLFSAQAASADLLEEAKLLGYNFQLLPKPIHPKHILEAIRVARTHPDSPATLPPVAPQTSVTHH